MKAQLFTCGGGELGRGTKPAASAYERWLGRTSVRVAWLALALAVLAPPGGIGLTLCWVRGGTGVPCPGCGLSRSLSCALRGMLQESWHYHPFGPLILALFVAVAVISLLPAARRERLRAVMDTRSGLCNAVSVGFLSSFAAFGLTRALLQIAGLCQFGI